MRRIGLALVLCLVMVVSLQAQVPFVLKYPKFVVGGALAGQPGTGTPAAVLVGVYENIADTAYNYGTRLVAPGSLDRGLYWIDSTSDTVSARNTWQNTSWAYAKRAVLRTTVPGFESLKVWTELKSLAAAPENEAVKMAIRIKGSGATVTSGNVADSTNVLNMAKTTGNGGWLGGHIYQSVSGPKLANYVVLAYGHDTIVGSGISEDNRINETFPADSGYFLIGVRSGQIDSLRVCARTNFTSTSAPYTVISRPWTVAPGCTTWVEAPPAYPAINAVTQVPQFPMSSEPILVSAQISVSGGSITTDSIRYAFNDTNPGYARAYHDSVRTGTCWYSLAGQAAGTVVWYHIVAYSNLGYRTVSPAVACTVALDHSIFTIQSVLGTGDSSADVGKIVHTTGIVTGFIRQDASYERLFISDSAGGPWSGIYVHRQPPVPPTPLQVGESLQIVGHVNEYNKQTEFENPRVIISDGGHGFDTTKITIAQSKTEPYEGVLVELDTVRVIGDSLVFNSGKAYWITNPARTDSVKLYVTPGGSLVGTPVPPDYFTLIANMVQYNAEFEAYPRVPADVQRLYPDIAALSITAPVSPMIAGDTVSPQVRVHNTSTVNTAKNLPVTFDIGGFWSRTVTLDSLVPGRETTVVFQQWTANPPGPTTMKAYTAFANDPYRHNDTVGPLPLQVLTHDLGVTGIDAPTGTIDEVSGVNPVARVRNFGTAADPYQVFFRILDTLGAQAYLGSLSLPGLTPNTETTLTFAPWPLAHPLGRYFTRCSTYTSLDLQPANNVGHDSFAVLAAPVLAAPANGALNQPVTATLQWNGVDNATGYDVYLGFDDPPQTIVSPNQPGLSYACSGLVNESTYYWQVAARHGSRPGSVGSGVWHFKTVPLAPALILRRPRGGEHWTTGTVEDINWLAGGGTPDYDSLWYTTNGTLWTPIARAFGTSYPWLVPDAPTVTAQIRIRAENFAGAVEDTSGVFEITRTLARPNVTITRPHGGEDWVVNADEAITWDNAGGASDYDSLWYSRDGIAWTPIGEVISGDSYLWHVPNDPTSTARIRLIARNSVGASYDTSALFSITSTLLPPVVAVTAPNGGELWPAAGARTITCTHSGGTATTDSVSYSTDGGATWIFQFRLPAADAHLWLVPATPTTRARVRICALNAAGPGSDQSDADFVIYSATTGSWVAREALPPGTKAKNVKDGGALAYGEAVGGMRYAVGGSDTGYVYAFKGNNRYEFYRYNTTSNVWISRDSIPAAGRSGKKKAVKKGSALTVGTDGKVYGAKGNNTLDFWRYDPAQSANHHWSQLTDVPQGGKNLKEGTGLAAVNIAGTDYVYLLKGAGTFEFYRYNTTTTAWSTMTSPPPGFSGKPYKNGSSIAYDGGDTIWCLKGTYNEFAAYSVANNTWVTKDSLPRKLPTGNKKTKVKDGSQIAYASGTVFALKGGNTDEFWAYQTDEHKWYAATQLTPGAKRVKGGGALVAAEAAHALYAFRGNNTREFWMYGPVAFGSFALPKGVDGVMSSALQPLSGNKLLVAPNPFRGAARVSYSLAKPGSVSLRLYDVAGKLVTTLASGYRPAGSYSYSLLTTRYSLASGIYLLKFEAEGCRTTEKLVIE